MKDIKRTEVGVRHDRCARRKGRSQKTYKQAASVRATMAEVRVLSGELHLELPGRFIQLFTYQHDVVLDPFIGSGTTAVAALQNNRYFIGYERVCLHTCRHTTRQYFHKWRTATAMAAMTNHGRCCCNQILCWL